MTLTGQLVDRVLDVRFERLPAEAVEIAKHVCLDGLSVTLAGATEPLGLGDRITRYVRRQGGAPQASVVAGGFKTSPSMAAFANGTLAHALDYDNTWYPLNHPTSPTLPAILALAESRGRSGRDVLTALVAAFEVQGRLRMASTGLHTGKGFHKPGTTGLFGAVTAAGLLVGLDTDRFAHAYGIAGSRAGSLAKNTGTMTKASHSGHAARMGVESAELAEGGFTASSDVFGPGGFFDTFFGDEHDAAKLVDGFAAPLRMVEAGVGFKKHPANYFTHRCIDAALAIRRQPGFDPATVESITVRFPDFRYVDRPEPASGLDGKFSVQYTTAMAILDGAVTIETFTDERRFAPDAERMLARTRAVFDEAIPSDFAAMHTVVTVRCADGSTSTERVDELSGMPGVPLTDEQRMDKFAACAGRVLDPPRVEELARALQDLEHAPDVTHIMDLARTERPDRHAAR